MPRLLLLAPWLALVAASWTAQESASKGPTLYPPSEAEQSPPGTEKFIVFGRDGDMASAFEYLPGTKSLVKRCDFGRSHVPPLRLNKALPIEFVRVFARAGRRSKVRRYLVDYRTWQAKPLDIPIDWRTRVMGRAGTGAYLWIRDRAEGRDALHRFDLVTGELMRMTAAFWKLASLGPYWLVQYEETEKNRFALLDTRTERVAGHAPLPPSLRGLRYRSRPQLCTSPTGRHVACMTGLDWNALRKLPREKQMPLITSRLPSSVVVLELETGRAIESPLWFLGLWSSKGYAVHHGVDLHFPDAEHLSYLSVADGPLTEFPEAVDAGQAYRVVIDLKSGEISRNKANKGERPGPEKRLDEPPKAPGTVARTRRIKAYLARHGALADPDGIRRVPNAFTRDGERFLAHVPGLGFVAGDFKKDELTRVEAGKVTRSRIYAVRIPR